MKKHPNLFVFAVMVVFVAALLSAPVYQVYAAHRVNDSYDNLTVYNTGQLKALVLGGDPYNGTVGTTQLSGGHIGAATKSSVVEWGDGIVHQSVLTLAVSGTDKVTLADGAHGSGALVYTFPEGRILILGATCNLTVGNTLHFNASTADTYSFSVGSVVGADDDDLTSTEADIIPKQTLDTASNATASFTVGAAMASSAQYDGTSTAAKLYANFAVAAANNTASNDFTATGTLTVSWVYLGDY